MTKSLLFYDKIFLSLMGCILRLSRVNMHKNNMKQTWRIITETLNKQVNDREIPTKIIHNDETFTDNEEIADCFNFVFCKHWRSIVLFLRRVRENTII